MGAISAVFIVVGIILMIFEGLKMGNARISYGWIGLALWAIGMSITGITLAVTTVT